jgi:NADH-quinone oxidoreductase subunit D
MDETVGPSEMIVHLGPQHPMQPGPFRLNLKLKGETVVDADIELGFIHKGIEKILENKTYLQGIPIVDRICYLTAMTNEDSISGLLLKNCQDYRATFLDWVSSVNSLVSYQCSCIRSRKGKIFFL